MTKTEKHVVETYAGLFECISSKAKLDYKNI